MRITLVIVCALMLSSCVAAKQPMPRLVPVNLEEYTPYGAKGTSVVYGEAFLRTRGGDVKKGAGRTVYMNPVTSYSTEWFDRAIIKGEPLEKADQRLLAYHWEAIADSDGRFEFTDLPAGEYYLICPIAWEVPHQNRFNAADIYLTQTGGVAAARVKVADGERKKVVLTR